MSGPSRFSRLTRWIKELFAILLVDCWWSGTTKEDGVGEFHFFVSLRWVRFCFSVFYCHPVVHLDPNAAGGSAQCFSIQWQYRERERQTKQTTRLKTGLKYKPNWDDGVQVEKSAGDTQVGRARWSEEPTANRAGLTENRCVEATPTQRNRQENTGGRNAQPKTQQSLNWQSSIYF